MNFSAVNYIPTQTSYANNFSTIGASLQAAGRNLGKTVEENQEKKRKRKQGQEIVDDITKRIGDPNDEIDEGIVDFFVKALEAEKPVDISADDDASGTGMTHNGLSELSNVDAAAVYDQQQAAIAENAKKRAEWEAKVNAARDIKLPAKSHYDTPEAYAAAVNKTLTAYARNQLMSNPNVKGIDFLRAAEGSGLDAHGALDTKEIRRVALQKDIAAFLKDNRDGEGVTDLETVDYLSNLGYTRAEIDENYTSSNKAQVDAGRAMWQGYKYSQGEEARVPENITAVDRSSTDKVSAPTIAAAAATPAPGQQTTAQRNSDRISGAMATMAENAANPDIDPYTGKPIGRQPSSISMTVSPRTETIRGEKFVDGAMAPTVAKAIALGTTRKHELVNEADMRANIARSDDEKGDMLKFKYPPATGSGDGKGTGTGVDYDFKAKEQTTAKSIDALNRSRTSFYDAVVAMKNGAKEVDVLTAVLGADGAYTTQPMKVTSIAAAKQGYDDANYNIVKQKGDKASLLISGLYGKEQWTPEALVAQLADPEYNILDNSTLVNQLMATDKGKQALRAYIKTVSSGGLAMPKEQAAAFVGETSAPTVTGAAAGSVQPPAPPATQPASAPVKVDPSNLKEYGARKYAAVEKVVADARRVGKPIDTAALVRLWVSQGYLQKDAEYMANEANKRLTQNK